MTKNIMMNHLRTIRERRAKMLLQKGELFTWSRYCNDKVSKSMTTPTWKRSIPGLVLTSSSGRTTVSRKDKNRPLRCFGEGKCRNSYKESLKKAITVINLHEDTKGEIRVPFVGENNPLAPIVNELFHFVYFRPVKSKGEFSDDVLH